MSRSRDKKLDGKIGKALRRWRRMQDDLSQEQAGALIGVSGSQWQKYESGVDSIRLSAFLGLCQSHSGPALKAMVEKLVAWIERAE